MRPRTAQVIDLETFRQRRQAAAMASPPAASAPLPYMAYVLVPFWVPVGYWVGVPSAM
jgi:hypothetical protein